MTLHSPKARAFTLVELIVGMGILVLLFSFLMAAMNQMTRTMSGTTAKVEQFRGARDAFERVTTRLAQATLNTYVDFRYSKDPSTGVNVPSYFERRSELRFLSGPARDIITVPGNQRIGHSIFFQAPLGLVNPDGPARGLENLLNTTGFFVEFGRDSDYRPKFIGTEVADRWRWRLMEYAPISEDFNLYKFTSGAGSNGTQNSVSYTAKTWVTDGSFQAAVRPVAENIVALVLTPRLDREEEKKYNGNQYRDTSPLAPNYSYDSTVANANPALNSKNQLPPVVQVTMVAMDEKSAASLNLTSSSFDIFGLSTKFRETGRFTTDLLASADPNNSLEALLNKRKVAYRIFTTNVHLRTAKWSQAEQ